MGKVFNFISKPIHCGSDQKIQLCITDEENLKKSSIFIGYKKRNKIREIEIHGFSGEKRNLFKENF